MPATPRPFDVLIVDDEPDVRELLQAFFVGRGFQVGTASTGRAAIQAFQRDPGRYGLVLVDLHLPDADGFEVLKAARQAAPSVYVVIVTGYASLESAIRAVREGAYDFLPKPFAMGQLDVVLARIEDRRALETENRRLARSLERPGDRPGATALADRLDAIDGRLTRIELVLQRIAGRVAPSDPR
jgi:DNA-binding NtrC family response regulator